MNEGEKRTIMLEALKSGEIGLNDARRSELNRVPSQGDWATFRHRIDPADLVWLTALTGDDFAILRGKESDILFHGQKGQCCYDGLLKCLIENKKLVPIANSSSKDFDLKDI